MLPQLLLPLSLAIIPTLASLEDLAHCDPLKKDTHCPPDPAFAGQASFDFTTADWNDDLGDFWAVDADSSKDHAHIDFQTDGQGAGFGIWAEGQAPTLTSNRYLLFGRISVEVLAAQGPGIITAIVLKSDSGDEIDWELLGAYENQAQTNYFYDGQALFNTYNTTYHLDTSSFAAWHKYSVEWNPSSLIFSIDDTPRKTWHVGQIPADKWPQTPMQVKLGVWSVSNDSDNGEIIWAGGVPNWTAAAAAAAASSSLPKMAFFKSLQVQDLTGLCNETDSNQVEYLYSERTHGWPNVQIRGCTSRSVPEFPDLPDPWPAPIQDNNNSSSSSSSNDTQPSRTGAADPNNPTNEALGDEGAAMALTGRVSSPLAAVILLVWILVI